MDIKAYISSGILELYCTGALTEHENREVEALARQYPEVKSEINNINSALDQYARQYAITPSPDLKAKILNEIPDKTPVSSNTETLKTKSNNLLYFGLIAATVAAILFYYKLNISTTTTDQLKKENLNLAKENLGLVQQLTACHDQMDILLSKDIKIIPLNGLPLSPDSKVIIYWNPTNKNTFVNVSNLPEPPTGKQYQLWALDGGKPIDAGVFNTNKASLQSMNPITSAQAFAVTLEKEGGSPSPTMDQMYVMGKI